MIPPVKNEPPKLHSEPSGEDTGTAPAPAPAPVAVAPAPVEQTAEVEQVVEEPKEKKKRPDKRKDRSDERDEAEEEGLPPSRPLDYERASAVPVGELNRRDLLLVLAMLAPVLVGTAVRRRRSLQAR